MSQPKYRAEKLYRSQSAGIYDDQDNEIRLVNLGRNSLDVATDLAEELNKAYTAGFEAGCEQSSLPSISKVDAKLPNDRVQVSFTKTQLIECLCEIYPEIRHYKGLVGMGLGVRKGTDWRWEITKLEAASLSELQKAFELCISNF